EVCQTARIAARRRLAAGRSSVVGRWSPPHPDRRLTTDDGTPVPSTQRPLRIVHIDAERGFSGGEVQVFLLIDALTRRGHENLLTCPPASAAAAEAASRGVAVAAVPMRGDLDALAVYRLRGGIAAAHPDLVHLHTGRAAWLGGLAA